MRLKLAGLGLIIIAALGACTTVKYWNAEGGSRADGLIRLSYDYATFETPVINDNQGTMLARERCSLWGYSGAVPFGVSNRQCIQSSLGSCDRFKVTREYQCTGNGNATQNGATVVNKSGRVIVID